MNVPWRPSQAEQEGFLPLPTQRTSSSYLWVMYLLQATTGCVRAGSAPGHRPSGSDVILVSIDSPRFDHVGCYGNRKPIRPTIDRLACERARCETAVAATAWMLCAHAAMFTGRFDYPRVLDIRDALARHQARTCSSASPARCCRHPHRMR